MDNNKKRNIIFIAVFLFVLVTIFISYLIISKKTPQDNQNNNTSNPQGFNPFGSGEQIINQGEEQPDTNYENIGSLKQDSRFKKLTDFAVAGAIFIEELKPIENSTPKETEIKKIISPNTKEGRKAIQKILNDSLQLTKPLVVDGVFGAGTTNAIKEFQKNNNLPTTGKIDEATNQFFFTTTTTTENIEYENIPYLRYVERANGHIYEMNLKNTAVKKISNSTIPTIYEAIFDSKGSTVIYRYLSESNSITSYIATLGGTSGEFLPQDILDISVTPQKDKFFYLVKYNNEISGSTRSFGVAGKETFFSFPFTEWLSQFVSDQKIYLTTKPSWNIEGSVYSLDKTSGVLSKIFGGVNGLTTLVDNSGEFVLYNTSTETGPKLSIYDIKNNTSSQISLYGLPEKCVWTRDSLFVYCAVPNKIESAQLPDLWYQGLVSFDDYIVKINVENREIYTLANSMEEIPMDGTHLFLDKNEETLFFINKKDSTLWSLDVF